MEESCELGSIFFFFLPFISEKCALEFTPLSCVIYILQHPQAVNSRVWVYISSFSTLLVELQCRLFLQEIRPGLQ